MRKTIIYLTALLLVCSLAASPAMASDSFSKTIEVFKQSPKVRPFFEDAYGYAVFPTVGKGGFVVGGSYGQGKVYRQGKATGTSSMIAVSVGFQAGGQAYREIIFFKDERAYKEFTSGSFEFDASASAVAITAGAQAKAGSKGATAGVSAGPATGKQAPTVYNKGMAVFIHTKGGLMYEASIGGQKFNFKPLK